MAAPFTVLILTTNAAVGILSRMLPQMHIMLFTFPISILLGLLTMYIVAPDLVNVFGIVLDDMLAQTLTFLRTV